MLELLAPAGNLDAVIAAVQNGADAVYMGFGDGFNARRSADNFTRESFAKAVRYCHIRGCKVYVTLNTLVGDREMEAAAALERQVECELRELSMPSVRFHVEITPLGGTPGFQSTGADNVRFLISANAGEALGRISKIASGGELSRIMLALKNVFAERDDLPSMVFDEVDAGVSGVAAQRVGEKLGKLSMAKQVICITHLPQIAAMADQHYLIEKREQDGRTRTTVQLLDSDGRQREIARLYGGEHITLLTLASAAEQLASAAAYKQSIEKGEKQS